MLTKLEIINEALAAAGFARVTSLDSKHPAFLRAERTFNIVNKQMQNKGWWFNRSWATLNPNSNGEIIIPQNASVADVQESGRYIVRGTKLFDRQDRTTNIGKSLFVRLVELLPVEDIPGTAQILMSSAVKYRFYLDENGTEPKLSSYRDEAINAQAEAMVEHFKHERTNYFQGNHGSTVKYPYTVGGINRRNLR